MKKFTHTAVCVLLVLSSTLLAHDRKVGVLIDASCGNRLAGSPDHVKSHQVVCFLKEECASTGYGVVVDKFYKFDEMGDKLAAVILKATGRKSNVRVRVDAHFDREVISPAISRADQLRGWSKTSPFQVSRKALSGHRWEVPQAANLSDGRHHNLWSAGQLFRYFKCRQHYGTTALFGSRPIALEGNQRDSQSQHSHGGGTDVNHSG